MSTEIKRYHPVLISLHWLLAAAILGMYVFGSFVLDDMENSAPGKVGLLVVALHVAAALQHCSTSSC